VKSVDDKATVAAAPVVGAAPFANVPVELDDESTIASFEPGRAALPAESFKVTLISEPWLSADCAPVFVPELTEDNTIEDGAAAVVKVNDVDKSPAVQDVFPTDTKKVYEPETSGFTRTCKVIGLVDELCVVYTA